MNFKMYNESRDYELVNEAVVRQAVAELATGKLEFLVLEALAPVADNAYVQSAINDDGLVLETRFIYNESKAKPKLFGLLKSAPKDAYKHYIKEHVQASEVQKVFLDYINGINPNVDTDGWEVMDI